MGECLIPNANSFRQIDKECCKEKVIISKNPAAVTYVSILFTKKVTVLYNH